MKKSRLILLLVNCFVLFSYSTVEAKTVTAPKGLVTISTNIFFDHSKTSLLNDTGISGTTNVKLYYVNSVNVLVTNTIYINSDIQGMF